MATAVGPRPRALPRHPRLRRPRLDPPGLAGHEPLLIGAPVRGRPRGQRHRHDRDHPGGVGELCRGPGGHHHRRLPDPGSPRVLAAPVPDRASPAARSPRSRLRGRLLRARPTDPVPEAKPDLPRHPLPAASSSSSSLAPARPRVSARADPRVERRTLRSWRTAAACPMRRPRHRALALPGPARRPRRSGSAAQAYRGGAAGHADHGERALLRGRACSSVDSRRKRSSSDAASAATSSPTPRGGGSGSTTCGEFGRRQLHVGGLMPFFKGGFALRLTYYAGLALALLRGSALPRRALRRRRLLRGAPARALPAPGGLLHHVLVLRPRDGGPLHGPPPVARLRAPRSSACVGGAPGVPSMNVVIVGNFWFPRGTAASARIRNLASGLRDCGARVHVMTMAPPPADRTATAPSGDRARGDLLRERRPLRRRPWTAGATPSERVPRLRRGFRDRFGGSAGSTAPTPFARRRLRQLHRATASATSWSSTTAALLRHGSPGPLVPRPRRHLGARRGRGQRAAHGSRLSALYWDSRRGRGRRPASSTASPSSARASRPPTARRAARARWSCPAIEELAAVSRRPRPPATPRLPPRLRRRLAAPGRPEPALRGHAASSPRRAAPWSARRDRPLRRHRAGTPLPRALRRGSGLRGRVSLPGHPQRRRPPGAAGARRTASCSPGATRPPKALSFPTRLVEYLRYGRPVFVSDVGDISHYLRDGEDVVLLHPSDPGPAAPP